MSGEAKARIDTEPHDAAERAACLGLLAGIYQRLISLEIEMHDGRELVSGEAFRLELRRIEASIDCVRQGLHRSETTEGNANGR